jgi:BirA family transcriptional regulator, biotin operon repressor / biotin---[acetyl-CoA-carboxylase] ligase
MTGDPRWPLVRSVHRFDEVDSTSNRARRMLLDGSIETPALVWADRQTRGRGQGSNEWWSDAGSLTATVVLDPSSVGLAPDREPMVALATATAVVDAIIERYPACRAGLRWPNDVEAGGRKLGGILPERVETPHGPRLLIGIGLNVETRLAGAPAEIQGMAATLVGWDSGTFQDEPIPGMLAAILERLGPRLRDLATDRRRLAERWNELDTLAGLRVTVEVGPEVIEGVAEGIDDLGGLKIRREGRRSVLYAGRVLRDVGENR